MNKAHYVFDLFDKSPLTLVAFCSVATAFADKFDRFRFPKNLRLKFNDGGATLFRWILNERIFWRVSLAIFCGVCVLWSRVGGCRVKIDRIPPLVIPNCGCDVLVRIVGVLSSEEKIIINLLMFALFQYLCALDNKRFYSYLLKEYKQYHRMCVCLCIFFISLN
jgi:hypothetical protein